jgi:magnesium transporter
VRDRLRKNHGRIRTTGADYLMYEILDAVIDSYFPVVDALADQLEELELRVSDKQMADAMSGIHDVRNELLLLRRNVWPHREAVNELIRDEHPVVRHETRVFLRDCYDHTIQLIDLLEVYREMCGDLRDFYLSLASNRMNEIMKVLTIIATIFIPLSFIAGLYGMNFGDAPPPWNMPELHWRFGYPFALGIMAATALGLLYFFRRKGWLGS